MLQNLGGGGGGGKALTFSNILNASNMFLLVIVRIFLQYERSILIILSFE
jgi:hypothetical protein